MNLPIPGVGTEPGPDYATDVNNSLTIVDQHNHSAGSGVQITPSGLNINSTLTMANNILSNSQALNFSIQTIDADVDSLYMKGTDLYFTDGLGNVIRFTQGGSLAGASGTITGLPSGTASASFAAGTFTFQSATSTPANIDGGSYIFRNNIINSKGLTLSPPNAMGADYQLFLPALPGSTQILTLDTSGNISPSTTANIVANSLVTASDVVVGGNMPVTGSASIGGTLSVGGTFSSGPITVASVTSAGDVVVGGNLPVTGSASVGGSFSAGATTVGSIHSTGVGNIDGALNVGGLTSANGGFTTTTFGTSGGGTVGGDLTINGSNVIIAGKRAVVNAAAVSYSLDVMRGTVNSGGGFIAGEGWTSSNPATGVYQINFTAGSFAGEPVVTATIYTLASGSSPQYATIGAISSAGVRINTYNNAGALTNLAFSFVAIGVRT